LRLFIGIEFDERTKKLIFQEVEKLKPYLDKGRLTSPDNYHLTLKFLGDSTEEQFNQIKDELAAMTYKHKKLDLMTTDFTSFKKKKGEIVFLDLKENKDMKKIVKQLESLLESIGFEPEDRPYVPHITVVRQAKFSRAFKYDMINTKYINTSTKKLTLFESKQVDGVLKYLPLSSFEF